MKQDYSRCRCDQELDSSFNKCASDVNFILGCDFANSAILVSFVSIYLPTSVCSKCLPIEGNKLVACLPSISITRFHWYYAAIRLPIKRLVPSLCIACSPYSSKKNHKKTDRISRVAVTYQCLTCHGLRLRRGLHYLALSIMEM